MTAPSYRQRDALRWLGRWVGFLAVSWLVLRPSLVVTISLDDFVNPFFVFDQYGPSPFGMIRSVSRDLTRAGHFNYIGQNFAAVVYVLWAYLISWGVKYSLIYATTKFVILVATAIVAARVLRRLAALLGRGVPLWTSRVAVAAALFLTLQLHVAWSLDPVGSFPLSGFLSVVVGLWAFDLALVALTEPSRRKLAAAAIGWCLAIQYYELNVVMVAAFVPIAVLAWWRAPADSSPGDVSGRRAVAARTAIVIAPAFVMTLVLQRIASTSNRGYTGTDVQVVSSAPKVFLRAMVGSLPASAWRQARHWLDRPVGLFTTAVMTWTIVIAVGWIWAQRAPHQRPSVSRDERVPHYRAVLLVLAAPVIMWVGATAIQATTQKVQADTSSIGFVYNFYAYGSVAVAWLIVFGLSSASRRPWWSTVRPVLFVVGAAFVFVQVSVNDNVQRVFDDRLVANSELLDAYTDQAPAVQRCAALAAWDALPYWLPYYRAQLASGLEAGYRHFHGEPFCPSGP